MLSPVLSAKIHLKQPHTPTNTNSPCSCPQRFLSTIIPKVPVPETGFVQPTRQVQWRLGPLFEFLHQAGPPSPSVSLSTDLTPLHPKFQPVKSGSKANLRVPPRRLGGRMLQGVLGTHRVQARCRGWREARQAIPPF